MKTKLTDDKKKLILTGVAKGLPDLRCAALAGVAKSSFSFWQSKGQSDINDGKNTVYSNLVREIEKTRAERYATLLEKLEDTAKGCLFIEEKSYFRGEAKPENLERTVIVKRKMPGPWQVLLEVAKTEFDEFKREKEKQPEVDENSEKQKQIIILPDNGR